MTISPLSNICKCNASSGMATTGRHEPYGELRMATSDELFGLLLLGVTKTNGVYILNWYTTTPTINLRPYEKEICITDDSQRNHLPDRPCAERRALLLSLS